MSEGAELSLYSLVALKTYCFNKLIIRTRKKENECEAHNEIKGKPVYQKA
jgi:hypothetical protein